MKAYLVIDGNTCGPYERTEIFALLAEKKVGLQDFALREGDSEWTSVGEVLKRSVGTLFSVQEIEQRRASAPHVPIVTHEFRSVPRKIVPKPASGIRFTTVAISVVAISVLVFLFKGTLLQDCFALGGPHAATDSVTMAVPLPSSTAEPSEVAIASQTDTPPADEHPTPMAEGDPNGTAAQNTPVAVISENDPAPVVAQPDPEVPDEPTTAQATTDTPVNDPLTEATPLPIERVATKVGTIGSRSSKDFFRIKQIKSVENPPKDELRAAWLQLLGTRFAWKTKEFVPYIEVQLQTAEQYLTKDTFVRVHFFDADKKLLETVSEPVIAWRSPKLKYSLPVVLPKGKAESAYFALPASVIGKQWTAIAVFGDQHSAVSSIYPATASMFGRIYPDQNLVERGVLDSVEREAAINPVTEVVMETLNPKQPTMTLFMRLPLGARSGKEAKGVLALCLLANNPTEIRQMLQRCDRDEDERIYKEIQSALPVLEKLVGAAATESLKQRIAAHEPSDYARIVEEMSNILKEIPVDPEDKVLAGCRNRVGALVGRIYRNNLVKLADQHQLAILAWGSRRLWNPKLSFDEQSRKTNREMDETFDDVAGAWAKGVDKLSKQYGFPSNGFLLTGMSGAAQYAYRLALRKPERFLAVHVHIPSSFDKPTPEGSKVLWLLTTGEKEGGYGAAKRFFNECKELGYPIIFKAIPGLGHQGSRIADQLGLEFFEYALSLREAQAKVGSNKSGNLLRQSVGLPEPWPDSFKKPSAIGDILNQDVFSVNEADFVPQKCRVVLPTEALSEAWSQ